MAFRTPAIGRMLFRQYSSKVHGPRANPEPILPVGVQIWESRFNKPREFVPEVGEDDILTHPLFTPEAKPDLGFLAPKDSLPKPLHFPEYDQARRSTEQSGYVSPASWVDKGFNAGVEPPIGNYPQIPLQWTQLKDPQAYWDKQGRRNYGEIVNEHYHFTNIWSIGPGESMSMFWVTVRNAAAFIGAISLGILIWSPEKHLFWAEKDYPFDGLRVMLGGDPNDPQDNATAAATYRL
ncbi:hypothetical protein BC833DRAFT_571338 [Globomyces pollinis-pini]|nr:hypothetical protein BC833DRAFT_571338 [Globomyces pollinis-pini]KAJ2999432.1 hypothetical protein HDV02_002917 [Globomyces sp. JEL0801]